MPHETAGRPAGASSRQGLAPGHLALALVHSLDDWATLDETTHTQRHEDHERVTAIIESTTDEVQHEVVAR